MATVIAKILERHPSLGDIPERLDKSVEQRLARAREDPELAAFIAAFTAECKRLGIAYDDELVVSETAMQLYEIEWNEYEVKSAPEMLARLAERSDSRRRRLLRSFCEITLTERRRIARLIRTEVAQLACFAEIVEQAPADGASDDEFAVWGRAAVRAWDDWHRANAAARAHYPWLPKIETADGFAEAVERIRCEVTEYADRKRLCEREQRIERRRAERARREAVTAAANDHVERPKRQKHEPRAKCAKCGKRPQSTSIGLCTSCAEWEARR